MGVAVRSQTTSTLQPLKYQSMASLSWTCDSGLYTRMTPFTSFVTAAQHAS